MIDKKNSCKTTTLENGLQVAIIKKDGALFSSNIGIRTGALHEGPTQKGICHFLEHMMFKGTIFRNNKTLNEDLEYLGGEYNAFTDYISTVFTITALQEEISEGLGILNEMVRFPSFPEEEMEKEKGVVLSELKSTLDDTESLTLNLLNRKAYRKSGLRTDILGTKNCIRGFTRKKLVDFHSKHYVPGNALLTIVSPLEFNLVLKIVRDIFGSWYGEAPLKNEILFEKNRPGRFKSSKPMEQSAIGMLYTFEIEEAEKLPLRILNYKLGNSANSMLFRKLREEMGLAYDAYSDLDLTDRIQSLTIYTQVHDDSTEVALDIIRGITEGLAAGSAINERDLEVMKKVMKTGVMSTLEDTHHLCSSIMDDLIDGETPMKFLEDIEDLENVTLEDVSNIAAKVLMNPTIYILRAGD